MSRSQYCCSTPPVLIHVMGTNHSYLEPQPYRVYRESRWAMTWFNMTTHSIFSIFTWNLKHVSYLNSEGVSTTDSGSSKKCFWVMCPVLVSMVTTGKPICRIQRFMITSTEWGSFMPFLSTAWWQEWSNVITLPLCEKHFRGLQNSAMHFS